MNKTLSITIGKLVFHIEEHAYAVLEKYLLQLNTHFQTEESKEEVIEDIEIRIAEIFTEQLALTNAEAVNEAMVNKAIETLGMPEEFEDGNVETAYAHTSQNTYRPNKTKQFFRNPEDVVIGGVCSGVSAYFGLTDPTWTRLVTILLLFLTSGVVLPVYLVLWLVIPTATTASEKLAMRGESINVDNIKDTVNAGLNRVSEDVGYSTDSTKSFLDRTFRLTGDLLRNITPVLLILLKAFGIFILCSFALGLGAALLAIIVSGSIGFPVLNNLIFESGLSLSLGFLSLIGLIGIPFLLLTYFVITLLFKKSLPNHWKIAGIMGVFWLLSLIGLIFTGLNIGTSFAEEDDIVEVIPLSFIENEPLVLRLSNEDFTSDRKPNNHVEFFDLALDMLYYDDALIYGELVDLTIEKSLTGQLELVQNTYATGKNNRNAREHASEVAYNFQQNGNTLNFADYFTIDKKNKFRGQHLELTLRIPSGTRVVFGNAMDKLNLRVDSPERRNLKYLNEKSWIMNDNGLRCTDCPALENADKGAKTQRQSIRNGSRINIQIPPNTSINKDFPVNDFNELDIHGFFKVNIVQGETFDVNVRGNNQESFDKLIVDQNGQNLEINYDQQLNWRDAFNSDREQLFLSITCPSIEELSLSGANKVSVAGFVQDFMKLDISGASELDFEADLHDLQVNISGATEAKFYGGGESISLDMSGIGKLDATEWMSVSADVEISGAGSASVWATESLDASVSGAGKIYYKGNPNVDKSISGAGGVQMLN